MGHEYVGDTVYVLQWRICNTVGKDGGMVVY